MRNLLKNLPKIKLNRKNFTKVGVFIMALVVFLMVFLVGTKLDLRKRGKRAETETAIAGPGHLNFVDPIEYGTLSATMAQAATANAEGTVQNLQAPTISGFSSDLFTGGATISYPLDLPPGRGGLTPSLSFNYSSNSVYGPMLGRDANGTGKHDAYDIVPDGTHQNWTDQLFTQSSQIGLGWDLSGLGSVFRDSNNRYTLVLNGQSYRLFKTLKEKGTAEEFCGEDDKGQPKPVPAGEWNECAGKWHTDPTGFLKIEHSIIGKIDGDEPDPGKIPENFRITDTNGTIYTFEPKGYFWKRCDYRNFGCKADDSTKPEKWAAFYIKWVLTRVADVHGNEISISYIKEMQKLGPAVKDNEYYPRVIWPYKIEYSGSGSDFDTKVEFRPFSEATKPEWPVAGPDGEMYDPDIDPETTYPITSNREDWKALRWAPYAVGSPSNWMSGKIKKADSQFFFSVNRIMEVNVKVKQTAGTWKIVRQYDLNNGEYFESAGDTTCVGYSSSSLCPLHPKLTKITARGKDGTDALPPYTFEYDSVHNDGLGNITNYRLLTKASNGYGGSVGYNYEVYTVMDYDPKSGDWVTQGSVFGLHRVTEKTAYDGRGNSFKTTYNYPKSTVGISDDGYHSGFESVGHNLVTENVFNKNNGSKIKETKYYFIQGKTEGDKFYVSPERGRVARVEVLDDKDTLLSVSETDYLRDPDDKGGTQNDIWNTPHFIAAKETRACAEPNMGYPLGSKATYKYNKDDQKTGGTTPEQWGNLTQATIYKVDSCKMEDLNGDGVLDLVLNGVNPYRTTHNTYFPNLDSHITNRVAETEILACNTDLVDSLGDCPKAKRMTLNWNIYDDKGGNDPKQTPGSKGLLTLSRAFYKFPEEVDATIGNRDTVDAKYEYYDFGNLKATTTYDGYGESSSATSGGGATRTSTIEYEDTYHTFPDKVINPLNHIAETYYKNGTMTVNHPYLADRTVVKDVNGQLWTNIVDSLGRSKESYSPGDDVNPERARTKIDYNDVNAAGEVNPFIVHTQSRDDKDDSSGVTYQHAWQFYNGLGQVIETQVEKEGDGAKIALTATSYNTLGQAEKTLLPYEAAAGGTFIQPDFNRPERTEADYDSLGRAIESRTPTNVGGWYKTKTGYYGRKTAVFDPKNHLAISEVDNLGRTLETLVFNKQVNSLPQNGAQLPTDYYVKTRLDYDHLNRVKKTTTTNLDGTPAKTAVSEVSYNQFGQKEWSKDPDLGRWNYTYYPTGTLKTVTDAKGKVKSFVYDDLNRIKLKYYGDANAEPVAFFVYDNTCQNGIGRLCSDVATNRPEDGFIETASVYNYDVKGRLVSEIKRIEGQNFVTQFAYDAAGRQRTVTYPDGTHETVTYSYNDAGLLNNVASSQQTYLSSVKYNVLGLPEEEVLGNQGKNIYTYEPRTYRLASKIVKDGRGKDLWSQNLSYDPVGNIEEIAYPLRKDLPGLPFKIDYTYDELNRLTGGQVAGLIDEAAKKTFYTRYTYDELGRMNFKQEEGEEPCNKTTVYPVNRNSALVAENLSETESGHITFSFFNNAGKSLFFVGDSVKPKNDSTELGKRSFVPVLVDVLSDIRSRYPNFEGFVVVESHKKINYPGRPDGPCIKVFSGTAEELCKIDPKRYSSFCPTPTPTSKPTPTIIGVRPD